MYSNLIFYKILLQLDYYRQLTLRRGKVGFHSGVYGAMQVEETVVL